MSMTKHIKRSGVTGWCQRPEHATLLVCGTGAGSLGDFSASAPQAEIFSVSSSDPQDRTMPVLGAAELTERFHSITWGKGDAGTPYGLIAGGLANGAVTALNAGAIVKGDKDGVILSMTEKHVGPVQGLDFNPNQPNLLASGGSESEIFIWDLSSPSTPKNYSPGAKVQQQTDITCLQWNPKVPHILASAAYNGVSVVWDLRAKRPVLTFSDPSRKQKCRSIAWNPIEAMQIVTASEEDTSPVISVWDLRNIYSPTKYLEGHTKGIWSVSWCPLDPGLLLSCGKHTEVFCWNMQTGKIQCEVETTNSWNSSVQWAPNLPSMFSVCSLEGQVKVFTLQDPTPRILGGGSTRHVDFSHPPKWLKKPAGATFGFGGKLFSFGSTHPTINVRTLVTDPEFVSRAERLEKAIASGDFKAFCDEKAREVANERDKHMWNLMKVLFEKDARAKLLAELEYDPEAVNRHVTEALASLPELPGEAGKQQGEAVKPASPPSSKGRDHDQFDTKEKEKETERPPEEVPHDVFAEQEEKKELDGGDAAKAQEDEAIPFGAPPPSGDASKKDDVSDLFGGFSSGGGGANFGAPEGEADPFNFGGSQSAAEDPFAAIAASQSAAVRETTETQPITTHERKELAQRLIDPIDFDTTSEDVGGLVLRALIVGNFAMAVELCIKSGRMADALILASYGGPELRAKTQDRYFAQNRAPFMRLVASIVKDKLQDLVAQTKLKSWKATLAVLCTYAKSDEFPVLCDFLGQRLEESGDSDSAVLCYMCAGNIDKTVSAWATQAGLDNHHKQGGDDSFALVDLLEKVNIFRRAIDYNDITDVLANKYSQYAETLAAQGQLAASMRYLSFLSEPKYNTLTGRKGAVLLDRVYHALGATGAAPPRPFAVEDVRPGYGAQPQQPPQQQQPPGQQPQQYQQSPQQYGKPGGPTGASYGTPGPTQLGLQTPPRREGPGVPSPRGVGVSAGVAGVSVGVGNVGVRPPEPSPYGGMQPPSPFLAGPSGGTGSPYSSTAGPSVFPPHPSTPQPHMGASSFPSPATHPPLGGGGGGVGHPPLGGMGGVPTHPPLGGGVTTHPPLGGGGVTHPPLGGGQPPLGGGMGGGVSTFPPLGGGQPSSLGGGSGGMQPPPLGGGGGARPPYSGGMPAPFGGAATTATHSPFPSTSSPFPPTPTVSAPAPSTAPVVPPAVHHPEPHAVSTPPGSLGVRSPPTSLETPVEQSKGPSIPSNTHLKSKEEKPAGAGQPTAVGTQVLNKLTALIDTFSVQFASDPRKAKAINDAKGRVEPLLAKLRNGELSAGAEGTLLELANALERGDKNVAGSLHKDMAGKYWEEFSTQPMLGLKRLVESL